MNARPRIRKTIKWGGAAVTAVLLAAWFGSGWGSALYQTDGGVNVGVNGGCFFALAVRPGSDSSSGRFRFERYSDHRYRMRGWWFHYGEMPMASGFLMWNLRIPCWALVLTSLSITAAARRLDMLARRRERLNLCRKCHYDRTGLAAAAVCPECGTSG